MYIFLKLCELIDKERSIYWICFRKNHNFVHMIRRRITCGVSNTHSDYSHKTVHTPASAHVGKIGDNILLMLCKWWYFVLRVKFLSGSHNKTALASTTYVAIAAWPKYNDLVARRVLHDRSIIIRQGTVTLYRERWVSKGHLGRADCLASALSVSSGADQLCIWSFFHPSSIQAVQKLAVGHPGCPNCSASTLAVQVP